MAEVGKNTCWTIQFADKNKAGRMESVGVSTEGLPSERLLASMCEQLRHSKTMAAPYIVGIIPLGGFIPFT